MSEILVYEDTVESDAYGMYKLSVVKTDAVHTARVHRVESNGDVVAVRASDYHRQDSAIGGAYRLLANVIVFQAMKDARKDGSTSQVIEASE